MANKIYPAAIAFGLLCGCTFFSGNDRESSDTADELLSYDELTATQPLKTQKSDTNPDLKRCQRLHKRFVTPYRNLYKALTPDKKKIAARAKLTKAFLRLSPKQCGQRVSATRNLAVISAFMKEHKNVIGVILPERDPNNEAANDGLVSGMRKALPQGEEKIRFVTKMASGPSGMQRALAELLLIDRASLVIGGRTIQEAQSLRLWADLTLQPTLVLAPSGSHPGTGNEFTFEAFPDSMRLGRTLAESMQRSGIDRLAILRPSDGKSDRLIQALKQEMDPLGIQLVVEVSYRGGDFDSLELAAKELLKLRPVDRAGEYQKAVLQAKETAKAQGVAFDERLIQLPPVVEFDAVFLPDEFRTLRHFVKLFRFFGVPKALMIGNFEWRSRGLIDPPEPALDGSFFVDLIGSYADLPEPLRPRELQSPLLIDGATARMLDFEIVGYHAARLAIQALQSGEPKRYRLSKELIQMTGPKETLLARDHLVFDNDRRLNWPSYIFQIANQSLVLGNPSASSPTSAKR